MIMLAIEMPTIHNMMFLYLFMSDMKTFSEDVRDSFLSLLSMFRLLLDADLSWQYAR